jgi:Elongation factor 1 gamma, conserved domain
MQPTGDVDTRRCIGGFFARLEASRKYIFGAASVYGASNDSVIQGAFMVRGQEALPAFDVAPDYESYEFTKLDPSKKEDKVGPARFWLSFVLTCPLGVCRGSMELGQARCRQREGVSMG